MGAVFETNERSLKVSHQSYSSSIEMTRIGLKLMPGAGAPRRLGASPAPHDEYSKMCRV